MNASFSRSLSLLRQEKGVSQRAAAQKLGVSQALLSHYENGIREPGLAFVVRACEYYNVSADFLLGRTLTRDGTVILDADAWPDAQGETTDGSDTQAAGSSKRLVINSVELIFFLLEKLGRKDAVKAASHFLSGAIYILFRHLYRADQRNNEEIFSSSSRQFLLGAAKLDMLYSEMKYTEILEEVGKKKGQFPDMSHEVLTKENNISYRSLLQIVHATCQRINRNLSKEEG